MKNTLLASAILLISTLSNAQESYERDLVNLLSPSYEQLVNEYVWQQINCYKNIDEEIIDIALEKHFERIQFFCFNNKGEK